MNPTVTARSSMPNAATLPWWRVRMVWGVVMGPLLMVVASLAMAWVALRGADPVVTDGAWRISRVTPSGQSDALTPALAARNHAATAVATRVPAAPPASLPQP
jgi:uncharacterized protein